MPEFVHPAQQFVERHNPRTEGEPSSWICVDERFAVIDSLYRQTGGGATGIGDDLYLTHRLAQNRGEDLVMRTKDNAIHEIDTLPEAYIFTGVAAETAEKNGVLPRNHHSCAKELNGLLIALGMVDKAEEIWKVVEAQERPGMNRGRFEQIIEAFDQSNVDGWVVDPSKSAFKLDNGFIYDGSQINPVERVELHDMSHIGTVMLLGNVEGTALNVRKAVEAGYQDGEPVAAYHASIGSADEIIDAVTPAFPLLQSEQARQDFRDITFVRNTGLSLFLPQQNGKAPTVLSYDSIPA